MPKCGAYLYIDCGQGMGDPLDPFGFVFHDEDCQLCQRIADLLQNQVYIEGAILSVQSADEIGDSWILADEELAYKEAQIDGTEEWDGKGLTWWARTIREYAQKITANDRRISRLQNGRGVKSNSSSPVEVSNSSAEQEHRREVQESLAMPPTLKSVRDFGDLDHFKSTEHDPARRLCVYLRTLASFFAQREFLQLATAWAKVGRKKPTDPPAKSTIEGWLEPFNDAVDLMRDIRSEIRKGGADRLDDVRSPEVEGDDLPSATIVVALATAEAFLQDLRERFRDPRVAAARLKADRASPPGLYGLKDALSERGFSLHRVLVDMATEVANVVAYGGGKSKPEQHAGEEAVDRHTAFVPSADPRVTTCLVWKTMMQFRTELLNNSRTDAMWWEKWFATVEVELEKWFESSNAALGAEWMDGMMSAMLSASIVRQRMNVVFGKRDEAPETNPADSRKIVLFPPKKNIVYATCAHEIDWNVPFAPIAQRGRVVEWIEGWIDLVTLVEAGERAPGQLDEGPTALTKHEVTEDAAASGGNASILNFRDAAWIRGATLGGITADALDKMVDRGTLRRTREPETGRGRRLYDILELADKRPQYAPHLLDALREGADFRSRPRRSKKSASTNADKGRQEPT